MSDETNDQPRTPRPVIALMGEFSAGKSTLANLLLGEGSSVVKVTATQLPPVWFTYGTGTPVAVDLEGNGTPLALEDLETVSVEDTAHIRVPLEAELLELMDIIDMPGNSDPNMSADVWRRAIHHATGVIWCTHSNQAWRQSEAAVWEDLPLTLQEKSLLLLTRFDKINGESDRRRVLRRVRAETDDLFRGVYPISLTEALGAGEDRGKWEASGAEEFIQALLDVVLESAEPAAADPEEDAVLVMPRRVRAPRKGRDRRDGEADSDTAFDTEMDADLPQGKPSVA